MQPDLRSNNLRADRANIQLVGEPFGMTSIKHCEVHRPSAISLAIKDISAIKDPGKNETGTQTVSSECR
jgi:hypothetical protein